ncbi:MAG: GTPase [Methylococcaceae bacterium]
MAYDYSELLQRVEDWAQQASELGWLNPQKIPLTNVKKEDFFSPFENGGGGDLRESRPLIVAFMGGTGVGKSSLLNRLAGKPIAKAGMTRPTSKEVTLFHHREITLPNLPLTDIRVANHDDAAQKNVVWIDMPDFDSTNAHNKELVFNWLPHIDVLIYVVSPERYRDEKAWRLLLAEGATHAWLFVLNQWDRGVFEQAADFEKQLTLAGFNAPLIFKTCCDIDLNLNDEFCQLTETLTALATQKTIEQLEIHGKHVRVHLLQNQLQNYLVPFGNETALKKLPHHWHSNWKATAAQLQQGFAWRLQPLAEHFTQHVNDLLNTKNLISLWDEWAQTRFDDALNMLIIDAQKLGFPIAPLELQLLPLREKAQKQFNSYVELQTRQALAQRGNIVQRALLKFVAMAEIVLPLAAMSWVGFQVLNGYYESNQTHDHYLNVDFAIHSTLVCGLSWLVPFFILKKCQPSLEKCAVRGLNKGISQGLASLTAEVITAIEQFQQQRTTQLQSVHALLAVCESITEKPVEFAPNSPLERMLVAEK